MAPARLMIADDHPLVLLGLKQLIEEQPNTQESKR